MSSPPARHGWWAVVGGYTALSVVITWPLATRATTSIAGDLGDPLFNAWVIGWVAEHLTRLVAGDAGAWAAMWNAPVFAPELATLTYSDHFIAQALQALPVWWASGNPLLAYNLVFLATMTLTGVAAHGFTVHLTGRHVAGIVAGVLCAFNEYRAMWIVSHLQILSIHWWIFAIWALDVFVERASMRALVAATAALVALNLSSSYLMAYSAPFTAALTVWSLARHGRLRDRKAWAGVVGAGAVSVLAVAPVLGRYLATRDVLAFTRTLPELVGNSATLALYAGALPWLAPFFTLAVLGMLVPRSLATTSRATRSWLFVMAGVAFVLALGPVIQVAGAEVAGPYALLWKNVPGFDGLRVPHRFVVIAMTLLAVLSGIAALGLWRSWPGRLTVVVVIAIVTRHSWQPPFPLDVPLAAATLTSPPAYLRPAVTVPGPYVAVTRPGAVLVEFPFGTQAYEIRYTYLTGRHRHRTLNGYSGVLPPSFLARQATLADPLTDADASWASIAPATHAVVHTRAWPDDTGERIRRWLESHGAQVLTTIDGAYVYELPGR